MQVALDLAEVGVGHRRHRGHLAQRQLRQLTLHADEAAECARRRVQGIRRLRRGPVLGRHVAIVPGRCRCRPPTACDAVEFVATRAPDVQSWAIRPLPLVGKGVPPNDAGRYGPGMRRSIATVSLSGTLNEKLSAAAHAGFDGVEIFDQDLLCSLWTPRRIKERCGELGLKIEMLQPFRDLEGLSEQQYARALRRFTGKLDIMAELGTDLVLVCANCQP